MIRYLRTKLDMTQKDMAIRTGLSQSTISRWENRKTPASCKMYIALNDVIDNMVEEIRKANKKDANKKDANKKYDRHIIISFYNKAFEELLEEETEGEGNRE